MATSNFICLKCKKKGIPIRRPKRQAREKGHVKHIYCVNCKKVSPHVELRNRYDFIEFYDSPKDYIDRYVKKN